MVRALTWVARLENEADLLELARGCRFPGCGLRFTDAHHVKHWADGGETSLGNLLLLCSYHHRLVHEEKWRVEWWGNGQPAFVDPRGQKHFDARPRPQTFPTESTSRRPKCWAEG